MYTWNPRLGYTFVPPWFIPCAEIIKLGCVGVLGLCDFNSFENGAYFLGLPYSLRNVLFIPHQDD